MQAIKPYGVECQRDFARNMDDAVLGTHLSLAGLAAAYGTDRAEALLVAHLYNLAEYLGVTITTPVLNEMAQHIYDDYYYLKLSEVCAFFYKYKSGVYGKVYGRIDPASLRSGIRMFIDERNTIIDIAEREKREKEREQMYNGKAVSREEYLRMVAAGEYIPPKPK